MKRMKTPLALIMLFFSLSCGDMATQVSNPDGVDGKGGDKTAPEITEFTLTGSSTVLLPTIYFTLVGNDDVGITGWMINESSITPDADDTEWLTSKPGSYILSGGAASYIVYAWAKDAAGNISDPASISLTYIPSDQVAPVINNFTLTSYNPTSSPDIEFDLSGTDNVAITGWMVNESSDKPKVNVSGWQATVPDTYTLSGGAGTYRVYAWAKDAAGNVSDYAYIDVTYMIDTEIPEITEFTLTSSNPSMTSTITFDLDGNDDVGITGWLINESSTAPGADDTGWLNTKPTSYMFSGGANNYEIYAWAKDEAGNVSLLSILTHFNVDYTPSDIVAPTLSVFSLNGTSPVTSPNISINLAGSDNVGITYRLIQENDNTTPLANDPDWVAWDETTPFNYTLLSSFGSITLYVWVKDDANNVSTYMSFTLQYNMPQGRWDQTNWDECTWGP